MCFYSTNKKFTFHHVPRSLCIDTIEVICTSLLLWPVLCLILPSLCISFLLWRTSILILSLLSALLLLLLGLFSWWLVLRSDLSLLLVAITLILHMRAILDRMVHCLTPETSGRGLATLGSFMIFTTMGTCTLPRGF